MDEFKLLIGGKLVAGDQTMAVINPATEEVLVNAPRASVAQLNQAVSAAKAAFPAWSSKTLDERRALLTKVTDVLEANSAQLARLLTQEQGKPLPEAEGEIAGTVGFFRYWLTLDMPTKIIEDSDVRRVEVQRRPLGVVGAIIPWNFPMLVLAFKFPPALLAGNTLVIKPSPTTPLTTLKFGELIAGILPPGVVNVITDANDLGDVLTHHPDVRKISFTGSTATGKKVMASAAETLKRITLELGGNDAGIVLDDADPKTVAKPIFASAFMNSGQVCLALKRLYVHESIYDEVCTELADLANAAIVDDGLKQGTQHGPLQNKMQYEKVKGFLEDARKHGNIIAGGDVPDRAGYFIRPTIVRDITDGTKIVDEEQFGPILPIIKYTDSDDAVRRANASPYGLGASVWSSDTDRAYDVASKVDAGTVWINQHLDLVPYVPFGGSKQSGIGVQFGEDGINEFTQAHIVNMKR